MSEHSEGFRAKHLDFGSGSMPFDSFLELIPDAIVVIDPATGLIISVNAQAEGLFGYPREELLGNAIEMLVPTRFSEVHSSHREEYSHDPRTRPMGLGLELSGRRKDGSEFPADISLSAIETGDGMLAAAAVRDLSGRMEAERERRMLVAEAREARSEQASRLESIGELAGGISHDFNNLLAVILTNSELALERVGPSSEVSEELTEIVSAAEHAAKLTRQLLVFSRHQVTPREPVDISSIVSGMEHLLRRSMGERVDLEVSIAGGLPSVLANPGQMEQVILNLVINARDSMEGGGRLGIATALAELDSEYASTRPDVIPGTYVRLTIADDGVGMPPEVIARAFEPFYSTKPKGEGTGLGLSTVYAIVKQYDGHVSIYSEEGSGTVVRVHFPVADASASNKQPTALAAPEPGEGRTVLVVEDSDAVRRGAAKILRTHGYEVLEADRGAAALELMKTGRVSLVLTDLVMPEMLGTELAQILASSHPDLPVIFMSGYADVAGPIKDTSRLIEKPFTSSKLLSAVDDALRVGGETG